MMSRNSVISTALLNDKALSVSALHGRHLITGGQSHGHILDPRTGHPVSHTRLSAVVHANSVIAEAWSTAVLVNHSVLQQDLDPALLPTSSLLIENNNHTTQPESFAQRTITGCEFLDQNK
jgi:thiamine biosynthesis lipoprotein